MTADTVIPAKAGIQYADNGMGSTAWSAMLETASRCSRWFALISLFSPCPKPLTDQATQEQLFTQDFLMRGVLGTRAYQALNDETQSE